jgi:hypothetical protein
MISKRKLIITEYLKMNNELINYIQQSIFPDFNDVIDLIFYFNYNFMVESQYVQTIDNILEINKIQIDDVLFEKVCDLIIDFLNLLKRL